MNAGSFPAQTTAPLHQKHSKTLQQCERKARFCYNTPVNAIHSWWISNLLKKKKNSFLLATNYIWHSFDTFQQPASKHMKFSSHPVKEPALKYPSATQSKTANYQKQWDARQSPHCHQHQGQPNWHLSPSVLQAWAPGSSLHPGHQGTQHCMTVVMGKEAWLEPTFQHQGKEKTYTWKRQN